MVNDIAAEVARVLDVALLAQTAQLVQLLGAHPGVVHPAHVDVLVGGGDVLVDPDDRLPAGVDAGLGAGRGLLDAQLRDAVVDGLRHAAVLGDLLDVRPRPLGEVLLEPTTIYVRAVLELLGKIV